MGKKLTDAQIHTLADKGKTSLIKGFDLAGVKKDGILKLTADFNIEFEEKETAVPKEKKEIRIACPKCKTGSLMKGNSAFGCSNWKSGCMIRLPFHFLSKSLTEVHLLALSRKGETAEIKGFVRSGVKVNGKIIFDENYQLNLKTV